MILQLKVFHLKSASVNHTVYLDYGFVAISEPHKTINNKISLLQYSKNLIGIDLTDTGILPNPRVISVDQSLV